MASWAEFGAAEPALAERVRERFAIGRHKTLATLRRDGSPRISGTETEFENGEVYLGMMPGSVKSLDLRRDPRLALHGPPDDPPPGDDGGWAGEAKIAGRGVEVQYLNPPLDGALRFRIDIAEVVLTHLNQARDRLVIESWHEGRGVRRRER
ncbi:MAG: pyridoxamine 5'-phosphate oxidase family protein [Candidatus Dormibacteraceae bacterium]